MTDEAFADAMRARIRAAAQVRLNRGLFPRDGRWVGAQDLETLERQRAAQAKVRYWELIALMGLIAAAGLAMVLLAHALTS